MNTVAQKNCPYCHKSVESTKAYYAVRPDTALDGMTFGALIQISDGAIGFDGQRYYFCSFKNIYGSPIDCCPMCGRSLSSKAEPSTNRMNQYGRLGMRRLASHLLLTVNLEFLIVRLILS